MMTRKIRADFETTNGGVMSINNFKVILGIMSLIMFFLMIFSAVYAMEDIAVKIRLIGIPIWGIQLMSLMVPNKQADFFD